MPGLSWRQKLQYTELGLFYITSALFLPMLMLVPVISLFTGTFLPVEGSALFPWLLVSLLYYYVFAKGNIHYLLIMLQYWVSHFWTYIRAFTIAVRSRNEKPGYKVTPKTRQNGFYGRLVWAQFLYLIAGALSIINGLFFMEYKSRSKIDQYRNCCIFHVPCRGSLSCSFLWLQNSGAESGGIPAKYSSTTRTVFFIDQCTGGFSGCWRLSKVKFPLTFVEVLQKSASTDTFL